MQLSGTIANSFSTKTKLFSKGLWRTPRSQTQQQWQQHFAKDCNAMDTTPGHILARGALSEDKMAQLHQEGKCFKCKRQGHIGHNCPNQNSQIHATDTNNVSKGTIPSQNTTNTSTASSGASNVFCDVSVIVGESGWGNKGALEEGTSTRQGDEWTGAFCLDLAMAG
jgi:hypothetical protein